ncbi:MAG: AAA family ATPase [Kineosporiaceae bacterium]|nr:AAA family ATPase [Kineosporiaceae bacterium]
MCRLAGAAPGGVVITLHCARFANDFTAWHVGRWTCASDLSRLSRVNEAVIASLERAVAASPQDLVLRLHLAEQLVLAGRGQDAVGHCAAVLAADPTHAGARSVMARALGGGPDAAPQPPPLPAASSASDPAPPAEPPGSEPTGGPVSFDWAQAESQVGDLAPPMFVDETGAPPPDQNAWDVERSTVTLADVGGMQDVKERLELSFLAPLRNPEIRRMFTKSLRGGLLLYGPPGCGKTFIARALAGEMGAAFISVGLSDILDMWIGTSERNVHELFQLARSKAPVVLFLDEIDALGQKRSQTRNSAMRGTVNQLLSELDGVDSANEGVFVLAATNQPWDVDPALRRPGRFDRTLLVLPPDSLAREAILRSELARRPVEGIELKRIVARSEGYSGADLVHLVESAAEFAMMDAIRSGQVRMIQMRDLERAGDQIRPSTGPWFDLARNVVTFADADGSYADLRAYMKKTKRL